MRKRPVLSAALLRRLEAGAFALGILWMVAVTAGSETAASAAAALRASLPEKAVGTGKTDIGKMKGKEEAL